MLERYLDAFVSPNGFHLNGDFKSLGYRFEATGDLTSSWTEIWNSTGVPYGGGMNASELATVQDIVSIPAPPTYRGFLRLKVTRP